MARYQMDDGTVVDTDKAVKLWEESTRWNGNNHISVNTGSQWVHQTLYRSRKGRYYVVTTSQWQDSLPRAEWVSKHDAARWLIANDEPLPDDLKEFEDAITE